MPIRPRDAAPRWGRPSVAAPVYRRSMNLASALLELVGAPACAGCRRRGTELCERCAGMMAEPSCRDVIRGADQVLAAWAYEGAARALVLALKLRADRAAGEPLVEAMCRVTRRFGLAGSTVTWVPGRERDTRERGFDHAEVLARGAALRLGLRAERMLARTGTRPDQTGLSAAARRRNLVGAFVARPCPSAVVLVDDVVTTGATASACALALRAAGAHQVEILVPCRKS
jgi:predicted amidophosphoribosyltransferase